RPVSVISARSIWCLLPFLGWYLVGGGKRAGAIAPVRSVLVAGGGVDVHAGEQREHVGLQERDEDLEGGEEDHAEQGEGEDDEGGAECPQAAGQDRERDQQD